MKQLVTKSDEVNTAKAELAQAQEEWKAIMIPKPEDVAKLTAAKNRVSQLQNELKQMLGPAAAGKSAIDEALEKANATK